MTFPLQDDRNTPSHAEMELRPVSRRTFLSAVAVAALSGCTTRETAPVPSPAPRRFHDYSAMYGALTDNGETIPTVPIVKLKPEFYRQEVRDPTGMPPGTIVVETSTHFLYLVEEGGRALRYGVGLGRAGFAWSGSATIGRKAAWPRWRPPAEMIARLPDLEQYRSRYDPKSAQWYGGMEPGIRNPLGARALYLYQGGKDTLYRIHGTPEWWTIGTDVSSGCVRMLNQDVIDLYERVPERTPVIVTDSLAAHAAARSAGVQKASSGGAG